MTTQRAMTLVLFGLILAGCEDPIMEDGTGSAGSGAGMPGAAGSPGSEPPAPARFRLTRMSLLGHLAPARCFAKAKAQDRARYPSGQTCARTAPAKPQTSVRTYRILPRANCPSDERHRQTPRR